MTSFNLKIGGIKQMLSKDQMKKIAGGYTGCENQAVIGREACIRDWGGTYLDCYSPECGHYNICTIEPLAGCSWLG